MQIRSDFCKKIMGTGGDGGMSKKLISICFVALLLLPNLIGLAAGPKAWNQSGENRVLAQPPELTRANLKNIPSQTEDYIGDHAPFRSLWLNAYAAVNLYLFDSVDNTGVITGGEDGWLFYTGENTVNEMLGLDPFPPEKMEEILQKLLAVRERYTEDHRNFVLFVAPDKEKIYQEYLPDAYHNKTGTSKATELVRYIRENSDIKVVYPVEELRTAAKAFPMYYKTDTHWNRIGAYVGSQPLIAALGGQTQPWEQLNLDVQERGPGDLALMGHILHFLENEPEPYYTGYYDEAEIELLEEDLSGSGLRRTETRQAPDSRSLTIVRDSFGDAMNLVLCRYFPEVTCINWEKIRQVDMEAHQSDIFVYEIVERWLDRMPTDLDHLLE